WFEHSPFAPVAAMLSFPDASWNPRRSGKVDAGYSVERTRTKAIPGPDHQSAIAAVSVLHVDMGHHYQRGVCNHGAELDGLAPWVHRPRSTVRGVAKKPLHLLRDSK